MRASLRLSKHLASSGSKLGVVSILVFSALLGITLKNPQIAHAYALPAYNYTNSFDTSGGGTVYVSGVAADSDSNTYVVGTFSGTVNFAGTSGNDTITDAQGAAVDGFITKYNSQGVYQWTRVLVIGSLSSGSIQSVAVDSNNNVYYTGQFNGTITFDSQNNSDTQTTTNGNSFLTRINADGSYDYTKVFDPETDNGNGVYVNASSVAVHGNDVYVAGGFNGTVNFDSGGNDTQTDPSINIDLFFTEFNADGSYDATQTMDNSPGADSYVDASDIALDSQGDVYLTGYMYGSVNFAGNKGSDVQSEPGNSNEAFITKFNADGSYGYTKIFDNTSGDISADSIAVDSQGNIYDSGYFDGTIIFGGTDTETTTNGSTYLTKYSSNGTYDYTKIFDTGSNGVSYGGELAIDSQNNVYLNADFSGPVNFDPSGSGDTQTAPGSSYDAALTKLSPDGTYDWTVIFDTTHGNLDYDAVSPVATDSIGQVLMTGDLYGSVAFDYQTDGDVHTDQGGNGDVFLTSIQGFTPISPQASPTSSPVALIAPDTGFGVPKSTPLLTSTTETTLIAIATITFILGLVLI